MTPAAAMSGPDGRHYPLTWWGTVLWWGAWFVLLGFGTALDGLVLLVFAPHAAPWPAAIGVWLVTLLFCGCTIFVVAQSLNMFTDVTLDDDGMWVRFFLRRRLVPWRAVERMMYRRIPGHIVWVRYVSPAHYLAADFGRQSVLLLHGLRRREELFGEIHRRASHAQGREIPVENWRGSPRSG